MKGCFSSIRIHDFSNPNLRLHEPIRPPPAPVAVGNDETLELVVHVTVRGRLHLVYGHLDGLAGTVR